MRYLFSFTKRDGPIRRVQQYVEGRSLIEAIAHFLDTVSIDTAEFRHLRISPANEPSPQLSEKARELIANSIAGLKLSDEENDRIELEGLTLLLQWEREGRF